MFWKNRFIPLRDTYSQSAYQSQRAKHEIWMFRHNHWIDWWRINVYAALREIILYKSSEKCWSVLYVDPNDLSMFVHSKTLFHIAMPNALFLIYRERNHRSCLKSFISQIHTACSLSINTIFLWINQHIHKSTHKN